MTTVGLASLAGCVVFIGSPNAAIVIDGTCDPDVIANCEASAGDPGAPWVVEDLHVSAEPGQKIGIQIEDLGRDLVLRDVRLDGFPVGIYVRPFRCPGCSLTVAETTIHASAGRHPAFRTSVGIDVEADLERVLLRNVEIETVAPARPERRTMEDQNETVTYTRSFSDGLAATGNVSLVELRDVRVTDATRQGGTGVSLRLGAFEELFVEGLHVAGYLTGLSGGSPRDARVTNARVECIDVGIGVGADHRFVGRNLTVVACDDVGLDLFTPVAALSGLNVTGSRIGVYLGEPPGLGVEGNLSIEDFSLVDNRYGISTGKGRAGVAVLENGRVADNAYAGIDAQWTSTEITSVTFQGNGHGAPDPERPDRSDEAYGGLVFRTCCTGAPDVSLAVHDGSFTDNAPYGITSVRSADVDARRNWWGCPTGPDTPGCDRTNGPVIVAPWSTSGDSRTPTIPG